MSTELWIQIGLYLIMFCAFMYKIDKRITIIEHRIVDLIHKQEKYNSLQSKVLTNELHIEEFKNRVEELKDEYRESRRMAMPGRRIQE